MAAPVVSLQPVKLAPGPSKLTPEQTYWRTFKSQKLFTSPSNNPITHISNPLAALNAQSPVASQFAVTTGRQVQIFSIRNCKVDKTISRFDEVAHSAEIRRDGRVMVAGDEGGTIQVFDVHSRAILKTWREHKQAIWTTKFSPFEATTLMSTCDDQTVRLWDLPSPQSVTTFRGHQDYIRSGAFMQGQAAGLLVTGSYDQTVKLWDSRAPPTAIMTFKHVAPVENVLPMPSGTAVLAAAGNQITVLDIIAARPLHIIQNHQKTVTSLSLASGSSRLVSGSLDGHLKVFETAGWNVITGSKYSSPILSLAVVGAGSATEDRHVAVGMQSGVLSIKTRLSGQQKVKEKERAKEMEALMAGTIEEHDRKKNKKRPRGWEKRFRGRDFTGEGADIIIQGNDRPKRKKKKLWEKQLRQGKYPESLDSVLSESLSEQMTLLMALRHRSAMRTALSGRDDVSLQPIFKWVCTHIINPQHVSLCVDVGIQILDLYSSHMGESPEIDHLMKRLHLSVRSEVERAQQAWQMNGMLEMLLDAGS